MASGEENYLIILPQHYNWILFRQNSNCFLQQIQQKKDSRCQGAKGKDQVKGCVNRRFALLNDNTEV